MSIRNTLPLTLLTITLIFLSNIYTSQAQSRNRSSNQFVLVLDPGHGGHDPGTMGNGGKEKDIVLAVALKAGEMIRAKHPDVRVIYTRSSDVFIGLQNRADFANRNHADLFMSIHVNSAGAKNVTGSETYVLGLEKFQKNLNVAMKENKAMLLEADYEKTYRGFDPTSTESYIIFDMIQNRFLDQSIYLAEAVERNFRAGGRYSRGVRQNVFWVQVYSAMPSVLIELGFLSNPTEAAFLLSNSGQTKTAESIANAFSRYYSRYGKKGVAKSTGSDSEESKSKDDDVNGGEETEKDTTVQNTGIASKVNNEQQDPPTAKKSSAERSTNKTDAVSNRGTIYKVQILASVKKIKPGSSEFKGIKEKISEEKGAKFNYYMVGNCSSLKEAKKLRAQMAKKFNGAYIVIYKNGKRTGQIYN